VRQHFIEGAHEAENLLISSQGNKRREKPRLPHPFEGILSDPKTSN
jgi:hypothetical protein